MSREPKVRNMGICRRGASFPRQHTWPGRAPALVHTTRERCAGLVFGSTVLPWFGRGKLLGTGPSPEPRLAVSPPPLFTVSSTSEWGEQCGRGWTRVLA